MAAPLPDVLALLAVREAEARALPGPRARGLPGLLRLQQEGRVTALHPSDWDPRKDGDPVRALAEITAALSLGRPALEARIGQLGGGYTSAGGGGGSGELTPTEAGAESAMSGAPDTAKRELDDWKRAIGRSLDEACRALEQYRRLVQPRDGIEKMADPGCELCAKVPAHWCPIYGARIIMTEPTSKKGRPTYHTLLLCQWCFQFTWPSRAGRLPEHDEVIAHAEGRRVGWHGGAAPRLIEVACPDCGDRSRAERRECKTCGHAGKVLKQVPAMASK
jgi:hypothetical protein